MGEPIRNVRINNLTEAPTPQNTPATAASSFIQRASSGKPSVPTIAEDGDPAQLTQNLSLISMIQGKLDTLVGAPSGYIDGLPKAVKNRIRGLKAIQAKHSELEAELENEIRELEKIWQKKYEPLYKKRAQLIAGEIEPTEEEILAGKKIEDEDKDEQEEEEAEEEEESDEEEKEEEKDIKGIPDFWLTALKTHPSVSNIISGRDDEALHYLTDIRMDFLDHPGFSLSFDFAENPFFTNKTLKKVYHYEDDVPSMGELTFGNAEGTKIDWKSPEQNLTVRIEKRKQRNKRTQEIRTVEKTIENESFFNFFNPPTFDEDDQDELPEEVEIDHEIGEAIRDLIPRAVYWFTGEAVPFDDEDEDDDFEDEEDFEDDDDDSDDDSDGDDNEGVIKSGGGASGGQQPECKQQ